MKTKIAILTALLLASASVEAVAQEHRGRRDGPTARAGTDGPRRAPDAPRAQRAPRAPDAPQAAERRRGGGERRAEADRDGGRRDGGWTGGGQGGARDRGPPSRGGEQARNDPARADHVRGDQARGDRDRGDRDRGDRDRGGWDRNDRNDRGPGRDRGGWDRNDRSRADGNRWRDDRGSHGRPRWEHNRYPPVYRSQQRFRGGYYRPPVGFYTRLWAYGDVLPRGWYGDSYRLSDWWIYDLPMPPPGFDWVRVGDDALLIDRFSGRVVQVVRYVFW